MPTARTRVPKTTEGEPQASDPHAKRPHSLRSGALAFARRSARLAASTGLAGSLAIVGLAGSTALPGGAARAQVADLCTGFSLDESLLRDRLVPLVQSVVTPIEGTVNPVVSNLGTVVGSLTANIPVVGPILSPTGLVPVTALNLDVDGLFDTVAVGDPLAIQLLAPDGTLIGPGDDCVVAADSFQLDGTQGLSIGGNTISGLGAAGAANAAVAAEIDAIAFGDRAATGAGSTGALALGVDSQVGIDAAGAIAIGDTATVGADATGSIAIGAGATVAQANSIALGAGSATTRGAEAGYDALALADPQTSAGEVNIGNRTLSGVAAGVEATDAANVAQLGAVANGVGATSAAIGAGASFDPVTGTFTPPAFTLGASVGTGTETFANVGDALGNLDGRTLANTTDITNLANGTVGLVQQLVPGGPVTVAAGTGGTIVGFAGADGPRVLTGVGAGALTPASTDAVNGAQLFAIDTAVGTLGTGLAGTAATFGAGASFDPATGTFTPPAFVLGETDEVFANVGDALENIDGRTIGNTTSITNLTNQIGSGAIGLVQQADPAGAITVGGATGGGEVSIAGTAGARTLTGLADGVVAVGSTAAVTGGQLAATNATVAAGLGGTAALIGAGASFDPVTGTFIPPAFVLGETDTVFGTVGDALENLDGRTITNTTNIATNTTNIANLTAQIGSGSIGLVQQADPAGAITIGATTGGTVVNVAGTAGPRTLGGLADGAVAAGSTEAVTGNQLAATNAAVGTLGTGLAANAAALGGGASYDPATGTFAPPSYFVQGAARGDVGTALGALDGQVNVNTADIANLQVQVGNGTVGLVQQAAPGAALTVGAATDGDAVVFNQTGGATRLVTGLSDGTVAAGSTDAVTGNQAFATGQSIASALGGGATVAADGTLTAPTYTVGGTGFTDAGSAFAALDASVTGLQNQVGAFDPDGGLVFVSVNSAAGPARATGTETVAIGGGAVASGANSAAYGSGALATGAGSSAFGQGASAGFTNSAAFGSGATATRDNQMVFGTAANTYTTPGITSAASRAAQSGPLDVVTTDAAGNLASLPLSDFFSGVTAIENQLGRMDRRLDRQSDGIAIAMALGAVTLPAESTFAISGSVGYFDDTAAFGISAIGQIADGWYLNGGVGVGTERGTVAGRAGLTYAW